MYKIQQDEAEVKEIPQKVDVKNTVKEAPEKISMPSGGATAAPTRTKAARIPPPVTPRSPPHRRKDGRPTGAVVPVDDVNKPPSNDGMILQAHMNSAMLNLHLML